MHNIIYEYQNIINTRLSQYIKNTPSLHTYFQVGWEELKAKQYCGIINHNGEDYYILPKIANDTNINLNIFTYMLIYASNININNEDFSSSSNHQSNNILEVFIQIFAKNLFKQLQKGIFREYITKQDNLTVLKGKYLINENLKYNFTHEKIYCEYDEFSENNILNQFFLFALKTLLNYTKNKKLLKQCELVLNEVSVKNFDINSLQIEFNRLNARYKNSFELALLLLRKSIPLFEKDKKSFAFLFDMNELFENFIGNIYKSIDSSTNLQTTKIYGNLVLKPDILLSNIIIDTKYKLVQNKDDLKTNDKYQMFVYGTNFGIKNTMLLYPQHIHSVKEELVLGKEDKIVNMKMRSINLDFNGGYDEYIKEIQSRVKLL
jgi:5-methylcytosine-specific restriction enzyme subunit McrC